MKTRSIGTMVLLFIFTFGIYPLYWMIVFHNELRRKSGEGFGVLGHVLMLIFTFGIYGIYWQYAAGKRLAKIGAEDRSVLYIVFVFVALSFLNPFLMQDQANKLNEKAV